ncbi:MAG TPA: hypothetical protein VEB66_01230 [Opitutaceae bacterium]|nr:hypothetical protein [Opitutaceae bacterium]
MPPDKPSRPLRAPRARAKLVVLLAAVAAAFVVLEVVEFEWSSMPELLARVDRGVALALMATLPVVGFPISPVYVGAGALFGPGPGALVVMGVTAVHLVATHLLARTVLRGSIERWRRRWSRRLPVVPPGERVTLVAMVVIVPALPYIARNALLAFSGVPLRLLLGVAVPLYTLRSLVSIFLGDVGRDPSRRALLVLAGVFVVKLAVSALLFARLRRRCGPPPGDEAEDAEDPVPLPAPRSGAS